MITPIPQVPTKIRIMENDDIFQVSDIERRSYEFPWGHRVFRECLLTGYHCIVLERLDIVVGYSMLSVAAGEAHILNLCVDPKFRQLGYGEQLLEEVLRRAAVDGVHEIFLEVRHSNEKAIALYQKKGFQQIADRSSYYQANHGREDAAVFSRRIKKY